MKKTMVQILVFLLILALNGCGSKENAALDFPLPQGFTLEQSGQGQWKLMQGIMAVGGLEVTPLEPDHSVEAAVEYLGREVQPPMVYEYMAGFAENHPMDISFILYNTETQETTETMHWLFPRDGKIWDLWMDPQLIGGQERTDILVTSGVDPTAEFIRFDAAGPAGLQFLPPEPFTLEPLSDTTQGIYKDGQQVGGLRRTELSPNAVTAPEGENDPGKQERRQYLESITPEGCVPEYVTMFFDQESPRPYAAIELVITETATDDRRESQHWLFWDDLLMIYDLWIDPELVTDTEVVGLKAAAGIGGQE